MLTLIKYWYIISFIIIAGMANGRMDHLQFHDKTYSPAQTWRNKYAKDAEGQLIPTKTAPAYYLGYYQPKYVEAFPYSSTALVFLTDPWHRWKAIMLAAWRTALVLLAASCIRLSPKRGVNILAWLVVWGLLAGIQALGFHFVYSFLY